MYESSRKETSRCASNLLAHEYLGHFEEAHHWNIQAKFYNEKFPLVYESDKVWNLYHEDHGAILKHKCGKRDSSIVLSLFFSHFIIFSFFIFLPFFSLAFLFVLFGLSICIRDNALIMMIITLLFIYNSWVTTQN